MKPSPVIPAHPLDLPGCIKIMLGQAASDALAALGDYFIAAVVHPDCTSPPEAHGRMILIALPASREAIDNATRVALGTMVAKPIRPAATPATARTTANPADQPTPPGRVKSLALYDTAPCPASNILRPDFGLKGPNSNNT
jgi:hypothetical protein